MIIFAWLAGHGWLRDHAHDWLADWLRDQWERQRYERGA